MCIFLCCIWYNHSNVVAFGIRVCLSSISFLKRLVALRILVCVLLIFFLFRSLLVMLDSLLSDLHLSSSLTQTWLLHSIQRGDLMRILEPLLLILFHPDTARLEFIKEHILILFYNVEMYILCLINVCIMNFLSLTITEVCFQLF